MPKVSIIVPIYNVEKYIRKCLDSLVNQKLEDIQIILVNDGSTDSSGEIAKEYSKKYKEKIIYLEKENGGLSSARNLGLKYATGKYISFVDSDDYVDTNLYINLKKYMDESYDMIKIAILEVDSKYNILKKNKSEKFEEKTGQEAFNTLYKSDVMLEPAWAYIYKADFWKNNKFEFSEGRYHEDFGLIPTILVQAQKVASTNINGYYYVQSEKSITRNQDNEKKKKMSADLIYFYDEMIKKLKELQLDETTSNNLKIYYTNCLILEINNISDSNYKKEYIQEIKKRKIIKNIKVKNIKQLTKRIILSINIELYLKLRKI